MDQNSPQFDKLLHQATRIGVVAHLVRCGGEAAFLDVCQTLGIKHPGALSAHNSVLQAAGYIELRKAFVGRKGCTWLVLTERGRQAFADHAAALVAMTETLMMAATATMIDRRPGRVALLDRAQ
jgi:hypothetical protein